MLSPAQVMVFPTIVDPPVIAVTVSYPFGTTSSTVTPVASLGPALATSIVKVTVEPTKGVALSMALVMLTSDTGIGVVSCSA